MPPQLSRCPFCDALLAEVPLAQELPATPAPVIAGGPAVGIATTWSPGESAGAPAGSNCPACGGRLDGEVVLCVRCGYAFRLGEVRATVVERLTPGTRRRRGRRKLLAKLARLDLGLAICTAGVRYGLVATTLLCISAVFAPALVEAFAGGGLWLVSAGIGFVGAVFCLHVPRASGGRLPLAIALTLDGVTIPLAAVGAVLGWTPLFAWATGLGAWMLFVAFLARLAKYLDRPDEAVEAWRLMLSGSVLVALLAAHVAMTASAPRGIARVVLVEVVTCAIMVVYGYLYFRLQYPLLRLLGSMRHSVCRRIDKSEQAQAESAAGATG